MPLSFRSLRQSAAVLPLPARRWRKSASSSPKSGTPSLFAPMKSARPGGARPSQTKETSSAMAGPLNPASAIVVVAGPLGASPSEGSPAPPGGKHQDREGARFLGEPVDQRAGHAVGPVDVLEDEELRPAGTPARREA